jgi:hypothetical protein
VTQEPGWAALPPSSARWLLPTKPRKAAASSVRIYHPMTIKGLVGWQAARIAASLGAFAFLPRGASLPAGVAESLRSNDIDYESLAVAKANHPARFLVLLLGRSLECTGVAKIALDAQGQAALEREALGIKDARQVMKETVQPPSLRAVGPGLLLLDPVPWLPRLKPWRLPIEAARALGSYSRIKSPERADGWIVAHGDFAPWNLFQTKTGWVLLDWEHSSVKPPFFDFWHYVLQAHTLLRRPSAQALVAGVNGAKGWVRDALLAYAGGLGRSPEDAPRFFDDYLSASAEQLAGKSHKEKRGLDIRQHLQRQISKVDP